MVQTRVYLETYKETAAATATTDQAAAQYAAQQATQSQAQTQAQTEAQTGAEPAADKKALVFVAADDFIAANQPTPATFGYTPEEMISSVFEGKEPSAAGLQAAPTIGEQKSILVTQSTQITPEKGRDAYELILEQSQNLKQIDQNNPVSQAIGGAVANALGTEPTGIVEGSAQLAAGVVSSVESLYTRRAPSIFNPGESAKPGMFTVGLVVGEAVQLLAGEGILKGISKAEDLIRVSKFAEVPTYSKIVMSESEKVATIANKGLVIGDDITKTASIARKDTGLLVKTGESYIAEDLIPKVEFTYSYGGDFEQAALKMGNKITYTGKLESEAGEKLLKSESIFTTQSKTPSFIARESESVTIRQFKKTLPLGDDALKGAKAIDTRVTESSAEIIIKQPIHPIDFAKIGMPDADDWARAERAADALPKPKEFKPMQPFTGAALEKGGSKAATTSASELPGLSGKSGLITKTAEQGIGFMNTSASEISKGMFITAEKASVKGGLGSVVAAASGFISSAAKPKAGGSQLPSEIGKGSQIEPVSEKTKYEGGGFIKPIPITIGKTYPDPDPKEDPTPKNSSITITTTGGGFETPPPIVPDIPPPIPQQTMPPFRFGRELKPLRRESQEVPFGGHGKFGRSVHVNPWNLNPLGDVAWRKIRNSKR